ncbi:MAG: mandelate racemase/muconate lactonizing enzyme family protein [Candidatus Bathyarchaeia archaeon]
MKITRVEFTSVKVPFVSLMDVLNRGENSLASIPKVIVKVYTDEGVVSFGETGRGVSEEHVQSAAQLLIGKDPLQMNLQSLGLPYGMDHVFEQVIHDLVGKALKVPVYKLLGGAYRSEVPVSAWSPHHGAGNPEKVAAIAKAAVDRGYNVIKLKAYNPADLEETVLAIEKVAGAEMGIVCDPNEIFRYPSVAIKLGRKLAGHNIVCFEDPVPKWNLNWYVLMRQKIDIPLALHVVGTAVMNAVKMDACDIINTGGTMHEFRKYAGIAEVAGIPVWHGSGVDLGLLEASYVHACAATSNATLTSDIFSEFCRVDDLITEPIEIKNGLAKVPQKPGLGVELDEKALEKYRAGKTRVIS